MKKIFIIIMFLTFNTQSFSLENLFDKAKNKYDKKKYEDSKFLFQRNIVFNPKDAESYLYLAKIFNKENNEAEEEKNLNTVLLLEPGNEDATYMLMKINLKKSNYEKVKDLLNTFTIICNNLCDKENEIKDSLKDIEPNNES